jgi:hypothetical protein
LGDFSTDVIHKNPGIKNVGTIRRKGKRDKVGKWLKGDLWLKPQTINISRAKCRNDKKDLGSQLITLYQKFKTF